MLSGSRSLVDDFPTFSRKLRCLKSPLLYTHCYRRSQNLVLSPFCLPALFWSYPVLAVTHGKHRKFSTF